MKSKVCLMVALTMWAEVCLAGDSQHSLLDEYKTYSLARCITSNYSRMGIDLKKPDITDYTLGFIDIEEGYAFGAKKDNQLDFYIEDRTAEFYKPKQSEGDTTKTNLAIYECVDFYNSDELDSFLRALLKTAGEEQ